MRKTVFYLLRPLGRLLTAALMALVVLGPAPAQAQADAPFSLPPRASLLKIKSAVIETEKGKMYFELFPEDAPAHVANFKYRADKGLYKNVTFDIFEPDYIIQGGLPHVRDPDAIRYSLPPEFNRHHHIEGTLGMARSPDSLNLERRSSGSQFHILLRDAPHMDGSYTVFGQLVKGKEVLQQLGKGDLITNITVYVRER